MDNVKLIESYKRGLDAIRQYETEMLKNDKTINYRGRSYFLKKGDYCIKADDKVLAKWFYLMDLIDKAIADKHITCDEMIEITESLSY